MKKSLKAALLSGLLFPGVGQLWLKQQSRGIALILAVSASLVLILAKVTRQALTILEKMELDGGAVDLVAVVNSAHASSYHDSAIRWASLVLVASWIISVVDAYVLGKRQDREDQAERDRLGASSRAESRTTGSTVIRKRRRSIMIKRRLQVVLLAMATLSCASPGASGGGSQPAAIAIDQGAAGSTVALRQGQRLTVSLRGNPTTGYLWEVAPGAESILALQGKPELTRESTKLGAGGSYHFAFQAIAPGSARLKFILRRPFESKTAPAETFEVTVTVDK